MSVVSLEERLRSAPLERASGIAGEVSEDSIALAFTAKHGGTLRFDHKAGKWFVWDLTRWRREETELAFHYARETAREAASRLESGRRGLGRAATAGGVERLARADRAHAVEPTIWDADPMLLGTPGGTVDLNTGILRPAAQDDYITRQTSVAPEPGKPTLWLSFLQDALGGDGGLVRFTKQWFGYCLTGDTREHALAFAFGPGGNGKSVWLNTMTAIMGDYAVTAALDTFTASRNERHSTELAMLNGARLVTASETERGKAWAESKLKAVTGGDPITARFMARDFFTFQPRFKLTVAANDQPSLSTVDDAMRRRFNILPFVHKPPVPDRKLEERLCAEHGRILAWAIAGCLDWQIDGLIRPQAVKVATAEYFDAQDVFGQWVREKCTVDLNDWDTPTRLFESWKSYAHGASIDAGNSKDFAGELRRRGFRDDRTGAGRKWVGVAVASDWAGQQ